MYRSVLLVFLTIVMFACSNNNTGKTTGQEGAVTFISGDLSRGENHDLYLMKIDDNRFVDSDTIAIGDKGSFETTIEADYPGFFAVRNDSGQRIIFTARGNDTVKIRGDYSDFSHATLSGSPELEQINLLNQKSREFQQEVEKITEKSGANAQSPQNDAARIMAQKKFQAAYDDLRSFSKDFIRQNSGSLVTLLALTNQIGPGLFVFHPKNDMDLFAETDSVLYANYPQSGAVRALHNQLITMKNQAAAASAPRAGTLPAGETAPEIDLPSPQGKNIKLSSTRGDIVLLDFWASWCPPCRRENPNLVKNYRKYHGKGFEIYQVSLDKDKQQWTSAIQSDQLDWIHVSDLKYWNSMVVPLYHINSIPTNYLLDKKGRIIASNLRGEELSRKLDEIFNQ